MPLHRIVGMPDIPHTCAVCGNGPTTNEGDQRQCIYAEGVDINWGDSLYICWDCGEIVADLVGRVTREGFDKLQEKYDSLKAEHDELLASHEEQEALLDKIREGNRAQKTIREKAKA